MKHLSEFNQSGPQTRFRGCRYVSVQLQLHVPERRMLLMVCTRSQTLHTKMEIHILINLLIHKHG
jgi:hypothetical protein